MQKLLFMLLMFSFTTCKNKEEKIKPTVSSISESVYASGMIKSKQQYQAFATVNGIIQKVYVKEGDLVKIGDSLLTIDNELQEINQENAALTNKYTALATNQGKINEAKQQISLQNSKMKNDLLLLTRQQNLWQQNIGSKVQLEQRELAYESSKTAYETAVIKLNELNKQLNFTANQSKNNLEISQKQVSNFTIKSEINGSVYKLYKEKGDAIDLKTPLALIGDGKEFILEMQVDEYDIFKIKKGLKVLITMDSYKGKVFEAKVDNISPMMNERSKTFLVKAFFVNPPKKLYPFISFEANIIIQTKQKALLIPRNLLLNDSTVVKSNGKKVMIKTGLKDYQMVEILSGLDANDELINPVK